MKKLRPVSHVFSLVLLVAASSNVYSAVETFIDFDATLGLDDNVTRAVKDVDVEHDTFVTLGASLGHVLWQGFQSHISVSGDATVNQFVNFDGLSNYTVGARAVYSYGFSAGFGASWASFDLGYKLSEFDSFLRDSDTYTTGLTFGKRIDDLTDLRTAFTYANRESEGKAFDTENVAWYINIDWTIQERMTLYTTYKIQVGDTFSTASVGTILRSGVGAIGPILTNGTPIVDFPDDVFPGMVTYQLEATTQFITVGLNGALDEKSSYDVSFRYLETEADVSDRIVYEDLMVRVSYFHRMGLFE